MDYYRISFNMFFFIYRYATCFKRSNFVFVAIHSLAWFLLNEQLRQAIALSVFLYSTTLKSRRCYWFLLLAMTFHYSAVFGLLFFVVEMVLIRKSLWVQAYSDMCYFSGFHVYVDLYVE